MNEITYTLYGDYYLPDLVIPGEPEVSLGKYGRLRKTYLKTHKPRLFTDLLTTCTLNQHLAEIHELAQSRMDLLVRQMAERQGVTEQLKADDQMAWVGAMNNIRACAEEIVMKEILYA